MLMQYLKNRKLKRKYKDIRVLVRHTLVADDDIISDSRREKLLDLKKRVDALDKRNLAEAESAMDEISGEFSIAIPRNGFFFSMRGFLDVLVVAASVAFGIRALYLQPFKIPTSSMQPTLFGIHYMDKQDLEQHASSITRAFLRIGASRTKIVIEGDGDITSSWQTKTATLAELVMHLFSPKPFYYISSTFNVGDKTYTVPGNLRSNILPYMNDDNLMKGYRKGDVFTDGYLSSGDHLFVDRLSLHFLDFRRGDIIVFNTENIVSPTQPMGGYYYIKRLVGIPGDTIKIENNTLMIRPRNETSFRPVTEFSPVFEKLYSFQGGYQGYTASGILASEQEITVPDNYFFALGDNTNHSLDGRNWGFIPRHNMIGRALNVFWPISRRWGVVDSKAPLPVDSGKQKNPLFQSPAMRMQ